ncbi:MAG: PEP-CTERM sorting domain-containing protein [Proteobacteria bacterium]|nr:PEP-CTERM sorting domain-containing protein [Pseudomonadota bacterium]
MATPTLTQHVLLGTITGVTLGSLPFTESGTTLNVVPEPGTGALVAFGLAALALRRRSSQT